MLVTEIKPAARRLPWLKKYTKAFELGFQTALEYRLNFLLSLISAVYPIFIQYFLWSAVYSASPGGEVYGYTYQQMMAYTFLAGLTSRIVRTGFEYDIMDDVKSGKYSKFLVQPLGYFPYRLASYFGAKLPNLAMVLIILAVVMLGLNAIWGIAIVPLRVLLFLATLALALALNFLIFYGLRAVAFWLTEIGFLFEGVRIVIILLSGGIFPLEVFGETFVRVTNLLPFKYTTAFIVNTLTGKIPLPEVYEGVLVQFFWIGVCYLFALLTWKLGGKRYIAVGG